jgi:hypothetical protein
VFATAELRHEQAVIRSQDPGSPARTDGQFAFDDQDVLFVTRVSLREFIDG